jgi:signal peptidase
MSTFLLTKGHIGKTYRAYIVQSGSMEPALPVGSVVFTKSSPEYQKGDIITFDVDGKLITHRIADIEDDKFQTKGDANEEADIGSITEEQIVGKSFINVPYVGYLADFVRTPRGFVMLVVIPAAIIIYEEIKAILRELKNAIFKKRKEDTTNTKSAAFIPFFGIFLLFMSSTSAVNIDKETAKNNLFQASDSFSDEEPVSIPAQ